MKINVIRNHAGKVIATFESAEDGEAPSVVPVLEAGHRLEELEVADNYKLDLSAFYAKHG